MSSYARVGVIIMITLASMTMTGTIITQQRVLSATEQTFEQSNTENNPQPKKATEFDNSVHDLSRKAPIATSGDNVYIAWWSNKTGNDEVMLKASTDSGKTFGNKMILSNSTNTESQDAQIAAAGNNVYITWWERNQTSNEPVLRVSNDNGKTFGERIMLSAK